MYRTLKETGELFKVLSDPTRIKILLSLAEEEKCVHEIARETSSKLSNISHHLRRMKDKNLVDYRREGRHKYYRVKDEHIINILKQGVAHAEER
ncbi:hypothetical protein AKJ40_00575 [candidate division MSBL1 archaeon SCGC-AAA259M10]|uniref:HTH arsR-type domain-containing protein n=1 Tax=candidate division MSBL1 archaeon SCGC-AAA259M10 TaxID=1698270 RepID=A0A133V2W3_9EURY|nr:hypothetical protein AKJ40_00575 [candidate division MSBL1 archaeon SCGC-AAA259M10]